MTSKEIRERPHSEYSTESEARHYFILREIAAQLAELNEFLRDEKSVFYVGLCASNDDIPVRIKT